MARLEDAAGLGCVVWWHSRTLSLCHLIVLSLPADLGAQQVMALPRWVQQCCSFCSRSGVVPALKVVLHCCSSSSEIHLFKIAGEWLEKVFLSY